MDVNVVASLMKSFLRRLPDPLLTDELYGAFIQAGDEPEDEKCAEKLRTLLGKLEDHSYETLRIVISHLQKVASHGEKNRMDARNLAIVFGPTIVRTADGGYASLVFDMKNQCKIVEFLILHVSWL